MSHSPALILQKYMIAQGILGDPEDLNPLWPLYAAFMPDQKTYYPGLTGVPDDCAAVYDYQGSKDAKLMSGEYVFHYGIQVKIRSQAYQNGWDKAIEVAKALRAIDGGVFAIEDDFYNIQNLSQQTPILALGIEEGTKRRFLFTINYLASIKKSDTPIPEVSVRFTNSVNLASGVPAALLVAKLAPGDVNGGKIIYRITCSNGTLEQIMSGSLNWVARNKAGTIDGQVQTQSDMPAQDLDGSVFTVNGSLDTTVPRQATVMITVTTDLSPTTTFKIDYLPIGNP